MQASNLFHIITQTTLKFRTELQDYKKFVIETDPKENNNSIKKQVVFSLQTFSKLCFIYHSGLYKMSLGSYLSSTKHKPKYQIPCMLILSRSLVMFFLITTTEKNLSKFTIGIGNVAFRINNISDVSLSLFSFEESSKQHFQLLNSCSSHFLICQGTFYHPLLPGLNLLHALFHRILSIKMSSAKSPKAQDNQI